MPRRTLANVSDKVLLSRLHELVKKEKQTTLSILLHLTEVGRRDLYLAYGFSSLYDYCVGALGYSRSAAGRRIAIVRCAHRYPEMFDLLESGEVNLTTIGHVAPILNDENRDLLLREIRGKTERQVESIVARYKPPGIYRDRVRPVRVVVPDLGQNSKNRCNPLILNSRSGSGDRSNCGIVDQHENQETQREFAALAAPREKSPDHAGSARHTEQRLLIQFLATEEFMGKLEEVKSLLSHKMPGGSFEDVFEAVLDEFIDRHSPKKRSQRREKRSAKKLEKQNEKHADKRASKSEQKRAVRGAENRNEKHDATEQSENKGTANKSQNPRETKTTQKRTRHIPAALRDKVFMRDNAQCTYVGQNGKRCGSTHSLQIDHIKPFAMGGRNTAVNLRLLCGKHNRFEAKRLLGEDTMVRHYKRE